MKTKTMYRVEKFLPTECPKCRHVFQDGAKDWVRLLGDVVDGEKKYRLTEGYYIIICRHCDNHTAQIVLEEYQLSSKKKAQEFCDKEGFVNLMEVTASGNHTKDMHILVNKIRGPHMEVLKIE